MDSRSRRVRQKSRAARDQEFSVPTSTKSELGPNAWSIVVHPDISEGCDQRSQAIIGIISNFIAVPDDALSVLRSSAIQAEQGVIYAGEEPIKEFSNGYGEWPIVDRHFVLHALTITVKGELKQRNILFSGMYDAIEDKRITVGDKGIVGPGQDIWIPSISLLRRETEKGVVYHGTEELQPFEPYSL